MVTKSRQEDRVREGLEVEVGEQLTEGEMEEIRGLDRGIRYHNRKVYTHSLFSQVQRSWPFLPFAVQDTVPNMGLIKEYIA